MKGRWARVANALLGAWLFLSAFAWEHGPAQFANTWLTGIAVVAIALIAMAAPNARYFNTAAAIWLFISTFALPGDGPTRWNNAIVALLIFAFSLVGERSPHPGPWSHHRRIPV